MMHDSVFYILQEELSQNRVALSVLLMDLLSQQAERRQQLLNTLREMEKRRWVDEEVGKFSKNWLVCAVKMPW
jgi:Mg2+/Co2+ transporter CorC